MLIKRKSNNRSTAMANADVSSALLCTVKVCLRPVSRSTDDSLDSSSAAPFRWLFRYPLKASTHPKIDFHTETVCCETTAALFNKAFSFCLFYGNFCWFFRIFSERDEAKQNKKSTFFSLCIRQIYWTNIFAKQHPSECEGWTDDVVQRKRFVIWLLIPSDG